MLDNPYVFESSMGTQIGTDGSFPIESVGDLYKKNLLNLILHKETEGSVGRVGEQTKRVASILIGYYQSNRVGFAFKFSFSDEVVYDFFVDGKKFGEFRFKLPNGKCPGFYLFSSEIIEYSSGQGK